MTLIKSRLKVTTLVVTLGLEIASLPGLATIVPRQSDRSTIPQTSAGDWRISQAYVPPNRQAPSVTAGGASRGGCFKDRQQLLKSLTPPDNLTLTTQEYPTFYWYIPESNAKELQFEVRYDDSNPQTWQKITLPVPSKPGVISINLQNTNLPALKVGQTYHWFLRMVCTNDSGDRSGDAIVEGWIERTESNDLQQKLTGVDPSDRADIYAAAGIWQDSVAILAELLRASPNDEAVAAKWQKLLSSAGLNQIANKPLVECCKTNR